MEQTRLVELSLYYKIQDLFARKKTGDIAKSADFLTYNLKYTNIQPQRDMSVYVNDVLQSNGYKINYTDGLVVFDTPLTLSDIVKADYYYCSVNMYDEGASPTDGNFKYPAIAVYEDDHRNVAIELGSNKRERHSWWIVEVWADRGGERNDISDKIEKMFEEEIDIIDYNLGFPVDSDGTKNDSFDPISTTIGIAYADSINCSKSGSLDVGETPKFLSDISVELIINI